MLQQLNQPRTVKVLRSFFYQGKVVEKDSTVKLPAHFAAEMVGANKCAYEDVMDPTAHPLDVDAAKPAAKKGG
mgnify:FL=1